MRSLPLTSADHRAHVSFDYASPYLRVALLLGSAGGFALACVLTLAPALGIPLDAWWAATVQTHGHLQLYGWAGLFVAGVALYFLPRLRGTPLARLALLPWILGVETSSLILRYISQPLLAANGLLSWKILLVLSGVLEALALPAIFLLLARTTLGKKAAKSSGEGVRSIVPFIFGAFLALSLAGILNLVNCVVAIANNGLIPATGDELNINLGLFGFLVPVALAMSSRMLPLYARIQPFPAKLLWILALSYFAGLFLWLLSILLPGIQLMAVLNGLGLLVIGLVLLIFTGYFLYLIRNRAQLPAQIVALAPNPEAMKERVRQRRREERRNYGPYVGLIGSAYLWASLGGVLLVIDGIAALLTGTLPVSIDVIRHSFAVGFITLLICGISVRMIPGFSSKPIRSPILVMATLLLGNLATLLRVGSLLLAPILPGTAFLFALSGPTGLILILCLTVNLWPTL
ncbi:MAG TPA: hypothetical protein VKV20_02445 [Ktedonobacteraceae bacterium]|jgi:uncharacterized protein involved in response to NO|nr:hypothetical protein [Ktedonobacteraceae bacterium]